MTIVIALASGLAMLIFVLTLTLLAELSMHRELGVPADHIHIGLGAVVKTWQPKNLNCPIVFSWLPISAEVHFDEERSTQFLRLGWKERSWIAGTPVLTSLVLAAALGSIGRLMAVAFFGAPAFETLLWAVGLGAAAGLGWGLRREISAHVLVPAALIIYPLVLIYVWQDITSGAAGSQEASPLPMPFRMIDSAARMSLFLGLLKLMPLDGSSGIRLLYYFAEGHLGDRWKRLAVVLPTILVLGMLVTMVGATVASCSN